MKTRLKLERFRDGELIELREQLSRSYTLDFMRLLYAQQAQSGQSASNLTMAGPSGPVGWGIGYSQCYGIVVGRGTTPVATSDTGLEYPIGHGRTYKALHPKLTNPSFETGDFTGWATSNPGSIQIASFNGATGKYVWYGPTTSTGYITQLLDFTNVTFIKVAYYIQTVGGITVFTIYSDGSTLYTESVGIGTIVNRVLAIANPGITGVKTLKIELTNPGTNWNWTDSIELYGAQLEFGGCEVTFPTFSGGTGEMTIKRFFYNRSGSSVTINEVGLIAYPGRLVLRDVVSPGVALAHGETLRATYQMQIIV